MDDIGNKFDPLKIWKQIYEVTNSNIIDRIAYKKDNILFKTLDISGVLNSPSAYNMSLTSTQKTGNDALFKKFYSEIFMGIINTETYFNIVRVNISKSEYSYDFVEKYRKIKIFDTENIVLNSWMLCCYEAEYRCELISRLRINEVN